MARPILFLHLLVAIGLATVRGNTLTAQALDATAESVDETRVILVNDHQTLAPGYRIGDVAVGEAKIADFRVMNNRRELILFGKSPGTTHLTVWNQTHAARKDFMIRVVTRVGDEAVHRVGTLLAAFPTVRVESHEGTLVIIGTVESKEDLIVINRIASETHAMNLVRLVPADPSSARPFSGASPRGPAAAPLTAARDAADTEYEIECFEGDAIFRSGVYSTGVEPSGRRLCRCTVGIAANQTETIFIGGLTNGRSAGAAAASNAAPACEVPKENVELQSGIRLTLTRGPSAPSGKFTTFMLIQTNLPFSGGTFDPSVWRRSRWQFLAAPGEPFGVTGSDLLATANASDGPSLIGNVARTGSAVATIPTVGRVPGVESVPILGRLFTSKRYKQKSTQLLLVLRSRLVADDAPRQ